MRKAFTGRHMAAAMVGFFTVVVSVNIAMATFSTRTFGGTVVDNSYVASQHFNRWLDEAATARSYGWTMAAKRVGSHAELSLRDASGPIDGAVIRAVAEHPLGRQPDVALRFERIGAGEYRSSTALPLGRWRLRFEIRSGGRDVRFIDEVPA